MNQDRLKEFLTYDPDTGLFTRLVNSGPAKAGDIAGSIDGCGYRQIGVDGRSYRAHRLAYLYMTGEWPPDEIDHINGERADNRWCNLRPAMCAENRRNKRLYQSNQIGLKGVSLRKDNGLYHAKIGVDGKRLHLGYYATPEAAHAAYVAAANKHFGKFMRAGQ